MRSTIRQLGKSITTIPALKVMRELKPGEVLWRYSKDNVSGSQWHVSVLNSNNPLHPIGSGASYVSAAPGMAEWLEHIVNAATVGGHTVKPVWGTPYAIVWFITDVCSELVEFIDT